MTADNTAGAVADSGRNVRFSPDPTAVDTRFSCDALAFDWLPPTTDKTAAWNELRRGVCAGGSRDAEFK